jgi:hypothetical protein
MTAGANAVPGTQQGTRTSPQATHCKLLLWQLLVHWVQGNLPDSMPPPYHSRNADKHPQACVHNTQMGLGEPAAAVCVWGAGAGGGGRGDIWVPPWCPTPDTWLLPPPLLPHNTECQRDKGRGREGKRE